MGMGEPERERGKAAAHLLFFLVTFLAVYGCAIERRGCRCLWWADRDGVTDGASGAVSSVRLLVPKLLLVNCRFSSKSPDESIMSLPYFRTWHAIARGRRTRLSGAAASVLHHRHVHERAQGERTTQEGGRRSEKTSGLRGWVRAPRAGSGNPAASSNLYL